MTWVIKTIDRINRYYENNPETEQDFMCNVALITLAIIFSLPVLILILVSKGGTGQ